MSGCFRTYDGEIVWIEAHGMKTWCRNVWMITECWKPFIIVEVLCTTVSCAPERFLKYRCGRAFITDSSHTGRSLGNLPDKTMIEAMNYCGGKVTDVRAANWLLGLWWWAWVSKWGNVYQIIATEMLQLCKLPVNATSGWTTFLSAWSVGWCVCMCVFLSELQ